MRVLVFVAGLLCWVSTAFAGASFTATTLSFDGVVTGSGRVRLLWEGEIANDSVKPATLCAVVVLKDAKGKTLAEFESAAVNVPRFGKVERKDTFETSEAVWAAAEQLEQTARLSRNDPVNGKRIVEVELYTTSWCPYCKKARAFLEAKGVSFTEYDVEDDADAKREKDRIAPGAGVPVAVIDGQVIEGFGKVSYEKALNGSGR